MFTDEMCRRRDFYSKHPEHKPSSAEESGEVTQFSHIYTADESISLSLEYYNNNISYDNDNNSSANTKMQVRGTSINVCYGDCICWFLVYRRTRAEGSYGVLRRFLYHTYRS